MLGVKNLFAAKNEQGQKSKLLKFFAGGIVLAVVIYSEVMFLSIVSHAFPSGIMAALGTLGAITTGASTMLLYWSKVNWFYEQLQVHVSWIFTGVEVVILVLNDMLAYSLHNNISVDSYLQYYQYFVAATPVISLIGWVVIGYLDPESKNKNADMVMQAEIAGMEREYKVATHRAEMGLKQQHLVQVTNYLADIMAEPDIQLQVRGHAQKMIGSVLTDVSGIQSHVPAHSVQSSASFQDIDTPPVFGGTEKK